MCILLDYPEVSSKGLRLQEHLPWNRNFILFDEPTSAHDPELVDEVLTVIKELAHDGMTMAIVTHEMKFAREVADRIVFMSDGVIVEEGPPEKFFSQPQTDRARNF